MNILKMMKQAKEMQSRLQEEMRQIREEATSGGGAVTVALDGNKRMLAVKIAREAMEEGDIEMLEDLILTATNEAVRRVDETLASKMSGLTGGMPIPGLT